MKNSFIVLMLLPCVVLLATACKKDDSTPVKTAALRIENATPWVFYNCTVDPSGTLSDNPGPNAYNFGQVDDGKTTSYITFTNLYRYAWIRLTMNGKKYYVKPYDYTGETVLEKGNYKYILTYNTTGDRLDLSFVKE